jgi:serine protease Do
MVLGIALLATPPRPAATLSAETVPAVAVSKEVDDAAAELGRLGPPPRAFVLISKVVRPSVVTVLMERKEQVQRGPFPFGEDWPFEGPNPFKEYERRYGQGGERTVQGMGSGLVVDKKGHVLTNNHVVDGAEKIKVILHDDSEYQAEVVGTDPKTDLAVISLKDCPAEKLVAATFGDSDRLEAGDWVLAVGAPFGLTQSVSAGIVSATGRTGVGVIRNAYRYENFIQTDAAINRGNSGGPLVNYRAEVVGINTAIATGTGNYEGVGFAIPSNMAKHVMSDLITMGRVVRGYLGVEIREVVDEDVAELKLPGREGVFVRSVSPDTPASKGGIEANDVIVGINGKPTQSMEQLRSVIAETAPGAKVRLQVLRKGESRMLDLVIAEQPEEVSAVAGLSAKDEQIGVTLQTLTEELASRMELGGKTGIYKGEKGVIVTEVAPGSPAAKAGVRPNDLIKEIGNRAVTTVAEYTQVRARQSLQKGILLLVKTGEVARLVLVK